MNKYYFIKVESYFLVKNPTTEKIQNWTKDPCMKCIEVDENFAKLLIGNKKFTPSTGYSYMVVLND